MSRADCSRIIKANENRIQQGRVLIILKDPQTLDDVVYNIAIRYGPIKQLHRPGSNSQLLFVQYESPESAAVAIEELRNYPIFLTVDHALKSERFCNGAEKNNSQKMNDSKDGGRTNSANRHHNNSKLNNTAQSTASEKNSPPKDVSSNGFFNSQDHSQPPPEYQPAFPLGCWFCTRMPNFECQCGAYYCDAVCQRSDWPKHKALCMPRLVPISYSNKCMLQEATASKGNPLFASTNISPPREENMFNSSQNYGHQQQQNQNKNNQNKQFNAKNQYQNQKKKQQQQHQTQKPQQQQQPQRNDADKVPNQTNKQQQQQTQISPDKNPLNLSNSDISSQVSHISTQMAKTHLNRIKSLKNASMNSSVGGTGEKRMLQPGRFPASGAIVKLTSSLPSGVVFIYHNNGQPSEYCRLANEIYQAAEGAAPLKQCPQVDDVIFAPFQDGFYRGKVLSVNGEQITVQYPDFGNMETIQWKEAKEIADERIKWANYLTYPVRLEGIETLTKEMKQLLEAIEGVEDFELINACPVKNSNLKEVVLKHAKGSLTLNMELIELREKELRLKAVEQERKEREKREKEEQQKKETAKKVVEEVKYKPVLFDDAMETKQLPLNTNQQLLIIDASELLETQIVSLIALADVEAYGAVVTDCGTLGPADPKPYTPREAGEVCLALHQQDWSRALYDIAEPGSYLLLDVGIIAQVPTENVRAFPQGLSRVIYNNEVIVENVSALEKMMDDDKPESLNGKLIDAHVFSSEDGLSIRVLPSAK